MQVTELLGAAPEADSSGVRVVAKLADFGISRLVVREDAARGAAKYYYTLSH